MITFLHLSDIHFRSRDHATQFDLDQGIRRALLEDVALKPAGADYDGVLITGDVAFSGTRKEYEIAKQFLDELFKTSGASATNTFVVPGNHDVDRSYVEPDATLWAAHQKLRESNDPVVWRQHIYTQLVKDPLRPLLGPLTAYNAFAQGFDCYTGMIPASKPGEPDVPRLSWNRLFYKPLEDGSLIRLIGLNSALISDAGDAPSKLLVSPFQLSELSRQSQVINLAMCHHPPDWLMDKSSTRNALESFVSIALFGHEHETRATADKNLVQLFAGAVQPSRRDPNWLPTYHILQVGVRESDGKKDLHVRVYTREYTETAPAGFKPRYNAQGQVFEDHFLLAPTLNVPQTRIVSAPGESGVASSEKTHDMSEAKPVAPTPLDTAQHELLVRFFQLTTPLRYEIAFKAGLLRDGDDTLDPQIMWAEVFRRAATENKFKIFWDAVAEHISTLKQKENPFPLPHHA